EHVRIRGALPAREAGDGHLPAPDPDRGVRATQESSERSQPVPARRALLTREAPPVPFKLHAPYEPQGDQPRAIRELNEGLARGDKSQVLLGVTGSGKTFTMANVIAAYGKLTLIISHNKTL